MNSIRACIFDAYGTLLDVHSAVMANVDTVGGLRRSILGPLAPTPA